MKISGQRKNWCRSLIIKQDDLRSELGLWLHVCCVVVLKARCVIDRKIRISQKKIMQSTYFIMKTLLINKNVH